MESKITLRFIFFIAFFFPQITSQAQETGTFDCKELLVSAEVTPACHAGSNGQISLVITDGMPPYQVKWNDGNTRMKRDASVGSFEVRVTDALGCQSTGMFTVGNHPPIRITTQVSHTSRSGKSNGAIALNTTGGKPPYHYSWISSAPKTTTGIAPNETQLKKLPAGKYKIVVFDAAGCYEEIETEVN